MSVVPLQRHGPAGDHESLREDELAAQVQTLEHDLAGQLLVILHPFLDWNSGGLTPQETLQIELAPAVLLADDDTMNPMLPSQVRHDVDWSENRGVDQALTLHRRIIGHETDYAEAQVAAAQNLARDFDRSVVGSDDEDPLGEVLATEDPWHGRMAGPDGHERKNKGDGEDPATRREPVVSHVIQGPQGQHRESERSAHCHQQTMPVETVLEIVQAVEVEGNDDWHGECERAQPHRRAQKRGVGMEPYGVRQAQAERQQTDIECQTYGGR